MKVRFSRNTLDDLGLDSHALNHYEYIYNPFVPTGRPKGYGLHLIEIGHESTVYAMSITEPVTRYFIREPRHGTITHFAAPAFDIIDNRLSSLWHYRREIRPKRTGVFPKPAMEHGLFAIKEWVEEPRFHEGVVEEWPREMAIMNAAADFMDKEFEE